ncbi:MAG: spherulation-specific family 4 protein [Streptomyces sp.]|uniref:spherulation-specific family 4 protein n=1 Tax=Streptomyces sp. TaxID=1931 RepID=UPI003D6AF5C4
MPHLTAPGGAVRAAAGTAGRIGFGVPGWAHPMLAPLEWAALARPGLPLHWAVLDVAGGPGARPDPYCLASAARSHEAGVGILGHLDMRDGARPFGELVSDAHRFLDWYRVDGFYLANCPAGHAHLQETRRRATTLRALCAQQQRGLDGAPGAEPGGRAPLVFAHGTHPHPGYAELADQLVTFAGGWTDYRWSQAAEWTADYPREHFCHLVHGVPRTHLDEALRIARWQGAGTVYFTDRTDRGGRNPWQGLPGYWDEIVSLLGPGVSE